MMKEIIIGGIILLFAGTAINAKTFEKDIFKTSEGDLVITFIGP